MTVKDLKKGQVFYEKDFGQFTQCLALTDAYQKEGNDDMWYCQVRSCHGETEFAQSESASHYGPKLSQYDY